MIVACALNARRLLKIFNDLKNNLSFSIFLRLKKGLVRFTDEPASNMHKTNLQQQITVHALPSKVWMVLTRDEYVNQYFFKENIHSDWVEGSPIASIPEKNEAPVPLGKVLEAVPGMLLIFRFNDDNPSVTTITTYELIIAGDGVELKMKCEGFNDTHPEWLIRVQHSKIILQKIKWLSEYS